MNAGIYSIANGPQLSESEAALLATLDDSAKASRPATHDDLRLAIGRLAERCDYAIDVDVVETGFTAVIAGDLRVVANKRGSGEETFYCQATNDDLLRMLAEELARACGPQIVLLSGPKLEGAGFTPAPEVDEAVLVIASN